LAVLNREKISSKDHTNVFIPKGPSLEVHYKNKCNIQTKCGLWMTVSRTRGENNVSQDVFTCWHVIGGNNFNNLKIPTLNGSKMKNRFSFWFIKGKTSFTFCKKWYYCSVSWWRPHKVDKRMVLVYTHGLFIT
jgi:hypothetical protein